MAIPDTNGIFIHNGLNCSSAYIPTAQSIPYNNSNSDLTATNVQDAIDEVVSEKAEQSTVSGIENALNSIGTVISGTTTGSLNVPSNSGTEIGSITLTKGVYILTVFANFASNPTGSRQVAFSAVNNPSRSDCVCVPACNKDQYIELVKIRTVTEDSVTIKAYAYQNSGSTLEVWPHLQAIKLK